MRPPPEGTAGSDALRARQDRSTVVVAGPGSSLTVPGIIVSEIVVALAQLTSVTRIEVDVGTDFAAELYRAPSLAAAHGAFRRESIVLHRAPSGEHLRTKAFRDWIGPDVRTAIAYAWPGIDNGWIRQFLHAARLAGAATIVACASLPESTEARPVLLADILADADLVLVGDASDITELARTYGSNAPVVEVSRALSLLGRSRRSSSQQITAFLPRDHDKMLHTLLAAFDAIPEARIDDYQLQVVMRYTGRAIPDMVEGSYYAEHVHLIGKDISALDLKQLCVTSSALIVADPAFDSRAFSTAVDSGIATVVLATSILPEVGRGYVGGLLADIESPASLNVALTHALRLAELRFPPPEAWDELARRMNAGPRGGHCDPGVFEPVTSA